MLYSLDGRQMTGLPKKRVKDFTNWRGQLTTDQYIAVVKQINKYIDAHATYFKSSYIPPKDWTTSVYLPLYFACKQNELHAGFFLGLIVWKTVVEREDEWVFKDREGVAFVHSGLTARPGSTRIRKNSGTLRPNSCEFSYFPDRF
jgi:hypothetical protein